MCLLLAASARLSAIAPDSLAGMVYRDLHLFSGISNAGETTIVLNNDGTYVLLKNALGVAGTGLFNISSVTGLPIVHWAGIYNSGSDGVYQYAKTDDATGQLTLIPNGLTGPFDPTILYFSTPTSGSTSKNGLSGLGGEAFYLTPLQPGGISPALANMSSRGTVTPGHPLIVGFVVPGTTEREVLIRVAGPALAGFGVSGAWTSTNLQITRNGASVFGDSFQFPFWSDIPPASLFPGNTFSPEAGLRKIFNYLGAFPFASGSKDIAVVIRLSPGSYTAVASAAPGGPGGDALLEFYPLP